MPPQHSSEKTRQPGRHGARRNAMMVLYKLDVMSGDAAQAVSEWETEHGFELPSYARTIVDGVTERQQRLDEVLQHHLEAWSVARLGAIERTVLRIGMFELLGDDVPDEVAIDEAVELAKRYASPEGAKLVNGVLGGWLRAQGKA